MIFVFKIEVLFFKNIINQFKNFVKNGKTNIFTMHFSGEIITILIKKNCLALRATIAYSKYILDSCFCHEKQ